MSWELLLNDAKSQSTGRFCDFYAQFPFPYFYVWLLRVFFFLLCLWGIDSLQIVREVFCCLSPLLFSLEHIPKKSVQKR